MVQAGENWRFSSDANLILCRGSLQIHDVPGRLCQFGIIEMACGVCFSSLCHTSFRCLWVPRDSQTKRCNNA